MKKVFVSFDFDNDKRLKDFLAGQAKLPDSPFTMIDWSLREAAPELSWEQKAEKRIIASDVVIVLVGHNTWRARGVLKEVAMARRNGIKIVQVTSLENAKRVENAGTLYRWNWDNLKKLLA